MKYQLIRCTLLHGEYDEKLVRVYQDPNEALIDKIYEEQNELDPNSWWTVELEE